jgi:HEAT repeats
VQGAAAQALAAIPPGGRSDEVIEKLLPLLGSSDRFVQAAAAQALAAIPSGDRANQVIDKLLPLLGSSDRFVRAAAAQALGAIPPGGRADEVIDRLLLLVGVPTTEEMMIMMLQNMIQGSSYVDVRAPATQALAAIVRGDRRAATGGGRAREGYFHEACLASNETRGQWLAAAWAWIRDLPLQGPVRRCWTPEQRSTLEHLVAGFQDGGNADALKAHLAREKAAPILQWLTWSLAGWVLFWAAFLFVFPWSRTIQAIFFWNPKVRDMLSLWFVPLLLLLVRPLRRRLLAPFRDDLVAAARPADLPRLAFFGQSRARVGDNPPVALETVLKGLQGVVVLRGDAGLGKTSALRWVAARSRRPVAFLLARDCAAGVDVTIAHLIHDIRETAFVRSMIYAGALMVIVDGLNEVSADTREKIGAFARDMSKGNVLIGTQPIEWKEPPGARMVDLLPLDRQEAERFLLSRPVGADTVQKVHGGAYDDAVRAFLGRALDEAPSAVDRQAAVLVLSNPFDLTFGADLLAQGSKPSATALIDEAFRLADEGAPGEPGYRAVAGQPFPLTRFGGLAVAMRLEDRNWFKPDEFAPELPCLLKRRLLVQRAVGGATGVEERIQFRHDRVWDFFIAAAFLDDRDLWAEHLADPRFRGAYLRIAETWPPEHAARVRDRLVGTAAQRGDHTTSDEFINRLEARRKSLETPGNESQVAAQ